MSTQLTTPPSMDDNKQSVVIFRPDNSKLLKLTEHMIKMGKIKTTLDFAEKFMFSLDSEEEFPINIEVLIEWGVFNKKSRAKKVLQNKFDKLIDYITIKGFANQMAKHKTNKGGRPSETIMMSVDCFKNMCMLSSNAMGKKIQRYYLDLEKVVKQYILIEYEEQNRKIVEKDKKIKEQDIEIINQDNELMEKDGEIMEQEEKIKKQNDELFEERRNCIKMKKCVDALTKSNNHRHKFRKGGCVYALEDPNNKLNILKFGMSKDITQRLQSDRTMCPSIKVRYIMYTPHYELFENILKIRFKDQLYEPSHEWVYESLTNLIIAYKEIDKVCGFESIVEDKLYLYNNEQKEKYDIRNNDIPKDEEYRENVSGKMLLSERLRNILPSYLDRAEYVRKNNEAPDQHRWCNGFCGCYVPLSKFVKTRLSFLTICMVCHRREKIAYIKIEAGKLTAEDIRGNPDLIDVGVGEKMCNICKTVKKESEFEQTEGHNRLQCKKCKYSKFRAKLDEFVEKIEAVTDGYKELPEDKLRLELQKCPKDYLCKIIKYLKLGRKSNDRKSDMVEKVFRHYIK